MFDRGIQSDWNESFLVQGEFYQENKYDVEVTLKLNDDKGEPIELVNQRYGYIDDEGNEVPHEVQPEPISTNQYPLKPK